MKIPAVTPIVYSGLKSATIYPKENAGRQFIYNEVLDITKNFHVPATFHTKKIELPNPTNAVLAKLKELGIFYNEVK